MRTRTKYNPKASVYEYDNPIQYVKDVLDSKTPSVDGWDLEGHTILSRRYSNLQDGKAKKIIAKAIVQLLDDPDYSCDAIPVAAELGLDEAKEWFLKSSEKPVGELRAIKTNDFSNGLGCLILYSRKHIEFVSTLDELIDKKSLSNKEIATALMRLGELNPEVAIEKMKDYLPGILSECSELEGKTTLSFLSSSIFSKYGDGYCIELAKRFKKNLPKEHQSLFYKALAQNPTPRFKPYLEELKKILRIS